MIPLRAALVAACLLGLAGTAKADNQMGYRLLSQQDAAGLPRSRGSVGLTLDRGEQISDEGLVFDVMRVTQVRRGSPAAQAGFVEGDQIIAVDGYVFPTIAAFASYVGSIPPGGRLAIDYMPRGTGPQQAQRITVVVGTAGQTAPPPQAAAQPHSGLTTGEKVAIGVGAIALFKCYEAGCFHHDTPAAQQQPQQQPLMRRP